MILGFIDHDRGELNEISLEMLTLARQLAKEAGSPLAAVLIGEAARPLTSQLAAYGVTTTYMVQHENLDDYAPEAWAQSIVELIGTASPEAVLAPGTDRGYEVLAHVAARLDLPLASNCTAVTPGDDFQVTRQRWGGSLLEEAALKGTPRLLTVAPLPPSRPTYLIRISACALPGVFPPVAKGFLSPMPALLSVAGAA
jgi:electron transfer flavoprotein alpha subunit